MSSSFGAEKERKRGQVPFPFYELDGVGNRGYVTGGPDTGLYVQNPSAPDPLDLQMNQYTSTPLAGQTAQTRLHDAAGNVTSMPFHDQAAGTVVQATATYDNHNQMVQYVRPGVVAEYRYDPLGRRAAKTLHDDTGSTPTVTTTFYLYSGDRVIEEREAEGGADQGAAGLDVAATYAYGNGIDEVLSMRRELPDGGGSTAPADVYYHSDDQGMIWALTDDGGAVLERYDYEDYGRSHVQDPAGVPVTPGALGEAESAVGNPYRYTGRRFDAESGLYWYRTRYYDPRAGRFTSRDTIGIWGDPANLGNGFSYVGNNPWTWVDPWGELSAEWSFPSPFADEPGDACSGGPNGHPGENEPSMGPEPESPAAPTPEDEPGTENTEDEEEEAPIPGPEDKIVPEDFIGPLLPGQERGPIPTAPPGYNPDKNVFEAWENSTFPRGPGEKYWWFYYQVRNKGPWDYKQMGERYENLGNWNYGLTGAASGIPLDVLLRAAGQAQKIAGTSRPSFSGSYGDDPHDQEYIKKGYRYYILSY